MTAKESPSSWFASRSVYDTLQHFNVTETNGLAQKTVRQKQLQFGTNELTRTDPEPIYIKFLEQLKQPLILLLLGSATISLVLGEYDDAFSITLAILIVVTVAFVQEFRSEQSLEALNKLVPHTCHVLRDGVFVQLPAWQCVPGDIVKFAVGDRIPADCRLIKSANLGVDESSLTGETNARSKRVENLTIHRPSITERSNIVYMGTCVRNGHGTGVVVATGVHTEFGAIWSMMKEVEVRKTPLQESMEQLGKQLSMVSFGVIFVIVVIGLVQGHPWLETFNVAVSLAVAAIPEGLPIVVTVTLALGVIRMAGKKAIVKRLPSVESLGSVNVICCDKTGTLTMNEMTVQSLFTMADGVVQVDGLQPSSTQMLLLNTAMLCNNGQITGDVMGQPTELALLQLAKTLGLEDARTSLQRLQEVPFDSETKWMAVQVADQLYYVKGALESIIGKCQRYQVESATKALSLEVKNQINLQTKSIAQFGHRVLAFAYGTELNDLTFLGLAGIYDPPRKRVQEAVEQLRAIGVRVVMITGDAQATAVSIAKQVGIVTELSEKLAVAGADLDAMDDAQVMAAAATAAVFYRTTPKHKLQLVKALQQRGDVVGMCGDGVNDSPALKLADIGISMGKTGTDVSKEAADMILVDDEFATTLSAIEEGKSIFYNIRNFLTFQLSTSVAALSLIAISTVFGLKSPLNPMQILWINIIMDGPPAQSLGVEPVDHDVMKRPPRNRNEPMVDRSLIIRVLTAAAFIVSGTLFIYIIQMQDGEVTQKDTTMTFTTFVLFDMFNALTCRSEKKSIFEIGFLTNKPLMYSVSISLLCQLLVIYVPFFQKIFQTVPLSFHELFGIVLLASSVWLFDELMKRYKRVKKYTKVSTDQYDLV